MEILIKVSQFLLSLSILIILHECGHFFPAKWFKTRVEKFYLFFDPYFSLFSFKKGETEYGIGWLPLGGYVKISGMIDESFDKEQMEGPAQPWEFRSKPAWQRLIIMVGGVTVNIILGILLFAMIYNVWGEDYLPNSEVKYGIAVDSLGYELGLRDGDKILKIGGQEFERFSKGEFISKVVINELSEITVERDGRETDIQLNEAIIPDLIKHKNKDLQIFGPRVPLEIKDFQEVSPAKEAGLKLGDKIIGINGESTLWFHDIGKALRASDRAMVDVVALRNGRDTISVKMTLTENQQLGVIRKSFDEYFNFVNQKYGGLTALKLGTTKSWKFITDQAKAFGQMFRGKLKVRENLGSLITIGDQFAPTWDWQRFWSLTAMLSILLGFINILPIPALDGGHVMFLLWEVITGRKPSDKVLEYSTLLGFIFLVLLMVFALGNDIARFFFN